MRDPGRFSNGADPLLGPLRRPLTDGTVARSVPRPASCPCSMLRHQHRWSSGREGRTCGTRVGAGGALPATLEVHVQTADMAEVASWVRGAERTGVRTVSIAGEDPLALFRSFVAVTYITRVAEGRLGG